MGLFGFFSGKKPEDIEKKGDKFYDQGAFGYAKIEYEKARERHLSKPSEDGEFGEKIGDKIRKACEGLALGHKEKAEEFIKVNCIEDARDLLNLAMELTHDGKLREELIALKARISSSNTPGTTESDSMHLKGVEGNGESKGNYSEGSADFDNGDFESASGSNLSELEDTFFALCSTLDEDEQNEYQTYGDDFMVGFVALNEGDFVTAKEHLLKALEKNSDRKTHIPLELALCYLNMGEYADSRIHAQACLDDFPDSENSCRIMCESFWAEGDYQGAHGFLDRAMAVNSLSSSIILPLLRGETFFQAGEYQESEKFYLELLKQEHIGQNEVVLRSLARTCQAMEEHDKARDLYAGLMSRCSGCGRMPDFALRRGFADSSFASGVHTTQIVEMFLNLVQEDPENRGDYYMKVSDIYAAQGHEEESLRFRTMAEAL